MSDKPEQESKLDAERRIEELCDTLEADANEWFNEEVAKNTTWFGRTDQLGLNAARARLKITKERISRRRLGFEGDEATFRLVEGAALDAAEAKLNTQLIGRRMRRIEAMAFVIILFSVSSYLAS